MHLQPCPPGYPGIHPAEYTECEWMRKRILGKVATLEDSSEPEGVNDWLNTMELDLGVERGSLRRVHGGEWSCTQQLIQR